MKKQGLVAIVLTLVVVTLGVGLSLSAQRSVTLATHAVGSLYNSFGTGLASVLSRRSPFLIRVQPFAGPPAWLPSMDKGETDMGLLTSADAILASKAMVLYKRHYKNARILIVGGAVYFGFYVPKDAPIETVADLKGKRIPTDWPGIPIIRLSTGASLATAGLTVDDVVKVPVSDLAAAGQAFLEGKTDAGWVGMGGAVVEEAYPGVVKAGTATGVVKDTTLLANDIYLVAAKELSDEVAYQIVKALWEHNNELGAAFHLLKTWVPDRMVSNRATIPYHPGAVKFFKEKGAWSKEMDKLQAELLKQ
ncbi:MAG: PhnD/SsuA/transferrin family substrate-binding protein [Deltaproteobacteria bacterium]|nr:PhnD/SsuA/transferrin family substrate-binding protein [Deltaproteobacteria bacterium]